MLVYQLLARLACIRLYFIVATPKVMYISTDDFPAYELYNKAVKLTHLGDHQAAISAYLAALALKYEFPENHQNVAILYEKMGQPEFSLEHHIQSVLHASSDTFKSSALVNLALHSMSYSKGAVILDKNEYDVVALLHTAIELNPNNEDAHFALGAFYTDLMQYDLAYVNIDRGIEINPHNAIGLMNKGNHFFRIGNHKTALDWYSKAQTASATHRISAADQLLLFNNIGLCLRETHRCNASIAAFSRALQNAGGDLINDLWTLSNVLAIRGICSYWDELELLEHKLNNALHVLYDKKKVATDSGKGLLPEKRVQAVDPYTFMLQRYVSTRDDLALVTSPIIGCIDPLPPVSRLPILPQNDVIRLGYFSYDWKDHPMGRLTTSLISSHDTTRFTVLCFYFGPPDSTNMDNMPSSASSEGENGKNNVSPQIFFRQRCTEFIYLSVVHDKSGMEFSQMPTSNALRILNSYELDILIDMTAHTTGGRMDISGMRPAKIVSNYLGYPGTTGCKGFQYNIVDAVVAPPDILARSFSEKMVYLPGTYQANDMPNTTASCRCILGLDEYCCRLDAMEAIARMNIPASLVLGNLIQSKAQHSDSIWLCAFNANKKMEPLSTQAWMNILQRYGTHSVLLLLSPSALEIETHIHDQAKFYGILPDRILFVPKTSWLMHLQRVSICDLALDNFVYGAHTTASDLLWQSIPIITIDGWGGTDGRMPSRVSSALTLAASWKPSTLKKKDRTKPSNRSDLFLADLTTTSSVKEFEDTAVKLAKNRRALNYLKSSVMRELIVSCAAFDKYFHQTSVESAYLLMLNIDSINHISGPMHLVVTPVLARPDNTNYPDKFSDSQLDINGVIGETMDASKKVRGVFGANFSSLYSCVDKSMDANHFRSCVLIFSQNNEVVTDIASLYSCVNYHFHKCLLKDHERFSFEEQFMLWQRILNSVISIQSDLIGDELQCRFEEVLFQSTAQFLVRGIPMTGSQWKQDLLDSNLNIFYGHQERTVVSLILNLLSPLLFSGRHILLFPSIPLPFWSSGNALPNRAQLALYLQNHAFCTMKTTGTAGKLQIPSVWLFASSFFISPLNPFNQLMLGAAMEQHGDHDGGFLVSSAAVFNQQVVDFENILGDVNLLSSYDKRIVFYCNEYGNTWWPNWGPNSMNTGAIGGSEEAVIMVSKQLADLGHNVEVYADILPEMRGKRVKGVLWLNYRDYNPDLKLSPDVFIAWRYAISIGGLCPGAVPVNLSYQYIEKRTLCILWLHDIVPSSVIPPAMLHSVRRNEKHGSELVVIVPSLFHLEKIPSYLKNVSQIITNGLDIVLSRKVCREGNVFVYASAPNRGLEYVLMSWEQIRREIPTAVLRVYYGFSKSKDAKMQQMLGFSDRKYEQWKKNMEIMLAQDGVDYVGEITPGELLVALSRASFLLYPTTFPEVGCITVMKAMSEGCIPITSRYMNSVLRPSPPGFNEGVGITSEFDLGPAEPYNDHLNLTKWLNEKWVPSVIQAFRLSTGTNTYRYSNTTTCHVDLLEEHRKRMQQYARETFSWREAGNRFDRVFSFNHV